MAQAGPQTPPKPAFVEWHPPAPPKENTAEAWLNWSLNAEKDYDKQQEILNCYYAEMRDKYKDQWREISNIRETAIEKLIAFGTPSIKLCVDMTVAHGSPNIPIPVLSRIGLPAVRPLLTAMRTHPDAADDVYQIFWQYKVNPGNLLAEIASSRSPDSIAAAKVLAFFAEKVSLNNTDYALGQAGCIDEKYRPSMIARLKGEKDGKMRSALLKAQAFFNSPDTALINEAISILPSDPDENVRQAAADALGAQLQVLSPRYSAAAEMALVKCLDTEKADEVLAAAAGALGSANGKVLPTVAPALLRCSKSNAHHAQWVAVAAICRLALENRDLIPVITNYLSDKNPNYRSYAATSLTELGPAAISAVPKLRQIIRDNPYGMASQAATILERIYPEKKE